ncbi:MAG: sulfite exporter TauE/SafE family protein [Anaerolineaceae bacterium]|nr:sulfite exporter TauE/SafE family protein [Anaerolineaceae bacterium]
MNPILLLLLVVAAIIASLFGQGGGVFYTPLQAVFGVDFHNAATTSLFLIMVTSLSATLVYRKAHHTDWGMAIALEVPTTIGAFAGGLISDSIPAEILLILLAILLVVSGLLMIRPIALKDKNRTESTHFWIWQRSQGGKSYSLNLLVITPIMIAVGMLTGMVGIGGGVLKVPAIVLLGGVPMEIAIGSSAFMVGITATAGLAGHLSVGHWDWHSAIVMGIGVFIGGQIGSRISVGLDKKKLKKLLGVFLLGVALFLMLRLLTQGPVA